MICFRLDVQEIARAFSRAFDSAGSSIAARIAMMAMTTSSSINVKECLGLAADSILGSPFAGVVLGQTNCEVST